ncbi:MAG: helix-turn-helix domain-containing protein [Muribaculaceae bacterium]|nr:helix-turn-helix domain-containing protein [Muribaculaceae bacterium]MBR5743965.1 helix-turn-helix domain-containing protein [Muribaculaceae bacterium]
MAEKDITNMTLDRIRDVLDRSQVDSANFHISQNLAVAHAESAKLVVNEFKGEVMRVNEYRVLIVVNGEGNSIVNLVPHHLMPGDVIAVLPGSIIQIINTSDDLEIRAIAVADSLFRLSLGTSIPKAFNGHLRDIFLHPDDTGKMVLTNMIECLSQLISTDHAPQSVYSLIAAIFSQVGLLFDRQWSSESASLSNEDIIFNRFIQLVNAHCSEHHTIGFYASRLCLSPRYLGAVVKHASGTSAKEWIDRALVAEAKALLRHTNKQIAEIAYDLNFPNPAFFGKFFRRLTDKTPRAYRETADI